MAGHLCIEQQFFKMMAAPPKVGNPNRGINDDHGYDFADLRLRMARRSFSVPPSLARRLLLSRAIRASSPRRTNAVFSLSPVKRDAFSKISSSMFRVVLICIYMHHSYIYVKYKMSLITLERQLFNRCLPSLSILQDQASLCGNVKC